jgi:DNA-directed RNA polymerase subunit RPC12/RpoP
MYICSICGNPIVGKVRTSQPVRRGICCQKCFLEIVKPRFDYFMKLVLTGELDDDCE